MDRALSLVLLVTCLGCGGAEVGREAAHDASDTGDTPNKIETLQDSVPADAAPGLDSSAPPELDSSAPDATPEVRLDTFPLDVDSGPQDSSPQDAELSDGEVDACPLDSPCTFAGYLPPCYRATCNERSACVASRIDGCCLADNDCPVVDPGACDTTRCLFNTCTSLRLPGCCIVGAETCDDGLTDTSDRCDPLAARCVNCPAPCDARPPLLTATFDDASATLGALGFFVADPQPNDEVTWQRTTDHFAAGGGALYLGSPRCRTYYGGALNAACAPVDPSGQDSGRIAITLYSPLVTLPTASPAVLTAWVRAMVEPLQGLGVGEPDVLRIQIETIGQGATQWTVGSTLDLGKSTGWAPIAVDLAPWRGQTIRARFDFDTLDGQDNRFEGVWLDEIIIREACTDGGCCTDDTDCAGPTACTRGACLRTAQGASSICATLPITPGVACTTCQGDAACADDDPCTHDACGADGACTNEAFCCLERDLFAASFDADFGAMSATDDNAIDGVAWLIRDGAAWFGDLATDSYGAAGRISGALTTPSVELPSAVPSRARATLLLTLRLSTEWDLATSPLAIDNPAGLDRLSIAVTDGAFTTRVWSSDEIGGTTLGQSLPLTLDLSRWLGRAIRVQVRFDSGDETLNTFGGAYIEALAVGLRCD